MTTFNGNYGPPYKWSKLEPEHGKGSIYSGELKANVCPGTFVQLEEGKEVVRVIKCLDDGEAEANVFKHHGDGFQFPDFELDCPSESNLCYLPEVLQTMSVKSIHSDDIANLAFVFKLSDLRDSKGLYCESQGINRAFMIHYGIDENSSCSEIDKGYWLLAIPIIISRIYLEWCHDCHPSGIWRGMMSIKHNISKVMGCASMKKVNTSVKRGGLAILVH